MGKPRDLANVVATGNILADGAVAPAELTGVTSTAAEINILDGVTATAAELNLMDGVTATTAELNHVDGVTSNVQTQMDTKAPVAGPTFTGTLAAPTINASTALQIGGAAITATAAELNKMDGVTVSASDINSVTAKAPIASPTFTGNVSLGDNVKLKLGDGEDLQIFHNGSASFIQDGGTGNLVLQAADSVIMQNSAGTENLFVASQNGAVSLYHDNSVKLATSGSGVTVTGTVAATSYTGDGSALSGISSSLTPNAITSNTTATASNHYFLNGTGITLTLPSSPSAGDQVGITEVAGNTDGVVARNSSNIMKDASNLNIDTAFTVITLMYVNASIGWAFA